ncbi:MFS transporter [Caldivirga maquilingensis]|uniref:Major facilitator superfamily MFS_1 n=1 Tax=Caldivirga maquilingensis (strain ATCC 700844 / DSM 13496 / JCM 10307 / IC-167) TaxID=397948 RepID=A8M9M2_CALMQ|nr:MFS transporter [Caldivirga maquilingensis]ABW00903.1 major facilitator superfamily MFS_1 [Caldivirga maquilingensis IC-167]
MEYKWVVLTNTTLGVIMSSINMYIVLISLPTIFRGLNINPFLPGEFDYLLWVLMGYSIVLASVLVTFGRISDLYGRTRLYTLGFIIFTIASILLSVIPSGSGNLGALLLIVFRMIQAVGGGFLMVNSTALLTDAFPPGERGKALGLNQTAFIIGSFLGIILGGLLSNYDWHLLFLVNVPFAVAGALWSVFKLRRVSSSGIKVKIDYWGNVTLAAGLVLISLGFTYALMPYGNSEMGWLNPYVVLSFIVGVIMLVAFIPIELRQEAPLFNLSLFKVRPFTYGIMALFLSSLARGALMFLLTIWLQGIYLPLHGFSYAETPFWAGIYMLSMLIGMVIMAPIGGALTDKYGARIVATVGMIIIAASLYLLTLLPYNFNLTSFELILFLNGLGNGLFSSPNTTSIMNALHPKDRGAGNGMRQTFSNVGSTISMAMFFSIAMSIFSQYVPVRIHEMALSYGLPADIASSLSKIPASSLLFAAFLGIDPASVLPSTLTANLPASIMKVLDSSTFLPNVLGSPFMMGLRISLYISIVLVVIGAVLSYMRGGRYVYEEAKGKEEAYTA